MDGSLLDVSADIIGETPKKKPTSPRSFAKDVVERLAIVAPNSGRVDATESLSSMAAIKFLVMYLTIDNTIVRVYRNSKCLYRSRVSL